MEKQIIYGDECLGYLKPAGKMSSEEAREVLESIIKNGLYEQITSERTNALRRKIREGGLTIREN